MSMADDGGLTLVTGASGFLGSWVVRKLVERRRRVRVMVRSTSNLRNLDDVAPELVEIVHGDKTDNASLRAALAGCRRLFDCAVDVRTWAQQAELERTNVLGTRSLMQAALEHGVERAVFCSAAGTIGRGRGGQATEDNECDWWDNAGPYIRSLVLAEREVCEAAAHGLPVVILNPAVTWGPGDSQPTPQGRMLIAFLKKPSRFSIPIRMCVADIEDTANMMIAAETSGRTGERYVIGGENLWVSEVFRIIAELAGVRPPNLNLPLPVTYGIASLFSLMGAIRGRHSGDLTLRTLKIALSMPPFDTTKARVELGYRPRPAREVFARTINWFRTNGYLD